MGKNLTIKKGVNIKLKGTAERVFANPVSSDTYVVKPTDFHGLIPKLLVKVGDEVKAGTPLFYDKYNERIQFTAPVSGEVIEINRGEKRRILEVKILADKEISYESFKIPDSGSLTREKVLDTLLKSGLWPFLRQRPYDTIANPADMPKSIFISGFNSAPLAPDNDFILHGHGDLFQAGLDVISKLTNGKVHLNVNGESAATKVLTNSKNVELNYVKGPHPAGNVGVQIHHIEPLNKGEVIWYLNPQNVLSIGALFKDNKLDATRVIALAGSEVTKPRYYRVLWGTNISNVIKENLNSGENRVICGDVLTGKEISKDGYLGFYDDLISVIPERTEPEFLGWLAPGLNKFSLSRTFFSWLSPSKEYQLDTGMNGEERAYVMTGEYENVFPMDIYPVHLVKAIMTGDIEKMENLGIYEVAPEDFALCEYSCTSKLNVQQIVREGLDLIKKECG